MIKLKVGDILYENRDRKIVGFVKIDRVTKTLAVAGNVRFSLKIGDENYIKSKSAGAWSTIYYTLSNEKVAKQYKINRLIYKIEKYKTSEFTESQLLAINKMIVENTKKMIG